RNKPELCGIVCDQSQPVRQRDGGDEQIVGADRCPCPFERGSNFAGHRCSAVVERERDEGFEECSQLLEIVACARTLVCTEHELRLYHRTQHDFRWFRALHARHDRSGALCEVLDASVRIEQVLHSSFSRSSNSPWGWRTKVGSAMLPAVASTQPEGHSDAWDSPSISWLSASASFRRSGRGRARMASRMSRTLFTGVVYCRTAVGCQSRGASRAGRLQRDATETPAVVRRP